MKLPYLLFAIAGVAAAAWRPSVDDVQVVMLTGDANGNLAPCGCTKPMVGGIKRRIEAIREMSVPGHTTLLDNGNLVAGIGRQDQIKAETMAEILGAAGYDAINIGPNDARLGAGMLLSVNSLSGQKLVSSQLSDSQTISQFVTKPPFLIIAVSDAATSVASYVGGVARSPDEAVQDGVVQAKSVGLTPLLLLQGDRASAVRLASAFPSLALVEYRSQGSPPEKLETVGKTVLVSPGSDAKYILRLSFSGGVFGAYGRYSLGPEFKDDPNAARLYRNYLKRVSDEHLLEQVPRFQTERFSGSDRCGSCHATSAVVWKHSLHSRALATLAGRGHDHDPECLPCHVVGLSSVYGFKSPSATASLSGVGCEGCHGPGAAHSAAPHKVTLPKVPPTTCMQCHTSNTSPDFSFAAFWKKIKHK